MTGAQEGGGGRRGEPRTTGLAWGSGAAGKGSRPRAAPSRGALLKGSPRSHGQAQGPRRPRAFQKLPCCSATQAEDLHPETKQEFGGSHLPGCSVPCPKTARVSAPLGRPQGFPRLGSRSLGLNDGFSEVHIRASAPSRLQLPPSTLWPGLAGTHVGNHGAAPAALVTDGI